MAFCKPQLNLAQYFAQYLWSATKGKVSFHITEASVLDPARRPTLRLYCKDCNTSIEVDAPTDMNLDYGLQEFVKLHAHNGQYGKEVKDLEAEVKRLKEEMDVKIAILKAEAAALTGPPPKTMKAPVEPEGRKFR